MNYQVKHPTALIKKIEKFGINHRNEFNHTPLMAAVWVGNAEFYQQLLQDGADAQLIDSHHLNVFQIALQRSVLSQKNISNFAELIPNLEQNSLVLQINHRLFKLESNQPEYLIVQLMYVMSLIHGYQRYVWLEKAFDSTLLLEYLQRLPEHLFDKKRQKRTYISSLFSKNEVCSSDKYNKQLFKRVGRGQYMLNPELVMKINGEWHPIYQTMDVKRVDYYKEESIGLDYAYKTGADKVDPIILEHSLKALEKKDQEYRNRSSMFFDIIGRKYDDKIVAES